MYEDNNLDPTLPNSISWMELGKEQEANGIAAGHGQIQTWKLSFEDINQGNAMQAISESIGFNPGAGASNHYLRLAQSCMTPKTEYREAVLTYNELTPSSLTATH